jgi:hypothetical protein
MCPKLSNLFCKYKLKELVDAATGTNVLTCPNLANDPSSCTLNAEALQGLFVKGVQLQECVYGECIPSSWTKTEGMFYNGTGTDLSCSYTPPPEVPVSATVNNNLNNGVGDRVGYSMYAFFVPVISLFVLQ